MLSASDLGSTWCSDTTVMGATGYKGLDRDICVGPLFLWDYPPGSIVGLSPCKCEDRLQGAALGDSKRISGVSHSPLALYSPWTGFL